MAYEKHVWEKGEKIIASKLNNIEDGVDSASSDILILEGVLTTDLFLDNLSFELTSGNVTDVPNYRSAIIKCRVVRDTFGAVIDVNLPYRSSLLDNDGGEVYPIDYEFGATFKIGDSLAYAYVTYNLLSDSWDAKFDMIQTANQN